LVGRDVDLGGLLQAALEGLHALAETAHHLGQAPGAEHDEHDDEHDEQLADAHAEHGQIIGDASRAGKREEFRCASGGPALYCRPPMRRSYREAYERLLPRVEKPGRYLGNERGAVRKDLDAVPLRFGLAFPEVYEIAQSHLGLQILYDVLNRRPDVAAERFF